LIALGQELFLALLGLGKNGRVFGGFSEVGQEGIALHVLVAAKAAGDGGFHEAGGKRVSATRIVVHRGRELGLGIVEGEDLLLGLIQKLLGVERSRIGIAGFQGP